MKGLNYEVDVLLADKPESLSQVDSIVFDRFWPGMPNDMGKFAISL